MHLHLLIAWFLLLRIDRIVPLKEHYCGSIDVRNSPRSSKKHFNDNRIQSCTVVEGDVRLSLITNDTITEKQFSNLKFTNLREITGFLLVYQVGIIRSLDAVFPALRVIRGRTLVSNYALVLFQNQDLKTIGLTKLTHISQGGVRIAENSNLCYADTLNWTLICRECSFIPPAIAHNQNPNACADKCDPELQHCATRNAPNSVTACWDYEHCQIGCPEECYAENRFCNHSMNGLYNNDSICCHKECLGGCVGPTDADCYACKNVAFQDRCLEKCPSGYFKLNDRRCLTKEQCSSRKVESADREVTYYKVIEDRGTCEYLCPQGYQENDQGECVLCTPESCKRTCPGSEVSSLSTAAMYKGCQIVDGSLNIIIQTGLGGSVVKKLENYLGSIQEVRGYVRISFTPSVVSMSIFRGLKIIRGNELWIGKYALAVFENKNLAHLWNTTEKTGGIEIHHGRVAFYLNPQLCPKVIRLFFDWSRIHDELHESDVSANGDKAVCEEVPIHLQIKSVAATFAVVTWQEFDSSVIDHRMFLGYQLYYRAAEKESVNIYENRDACSDSWNMLFQESNGRGLLLTHLEPNTLYAAYVKTLVIYTQQANGTMTGAISPVVFFRTSFDHPSPPILSRLESPDPYSINVEWLPPESPNGQVTHYIVSYTLRPDTIPKERNYCDEPPNYGSKGMEGSSPSIPNKSLSSTQAPNGESLSSSLSPPFKQRYCAGLPCCDCSTVLNVSGATDDELPSDFDAIHERAVFENIILNTVFVGVRRGKRSAPLRGVGDWSSPLRNSGDWSAPSKDAFDWSRSFKDAADWSVASKYRRTFSAIDDEWNASGGSGAANVPAAPPSPSVLSADDESKKSAKLLRRRFSANEMSSLNNTGRLSAGRMTLTSKSKIWTPQSPDSASPSHVVVNVTALNATFRGLRHFTSYEIRISACQNTSVQSHYCSKTDLFRIVRTPFIESADAINASSLQALNVSKESSTEARLIKWDAPVSPNGHIVAYEVEYLRQVPSTSPDKQALVAKKTCILSSAYKNASGVYLFDLLAGNYSVSVRAVSLAQRGPWSSKIYFFIPPRRVTSLATVLLLSLGSGLVFVLVGIGLGVYIYRRYFKRHMNEYVMKVVSANPDYLSSIEVYVRDEWELKRESIVLGEEIGRGCFGTVYKGHGVDNNVQSVCGARFGPCAIKTAFEKSIIDRFQFLLEASLMKDLSTSFIVKLYGVVSDGHPAWVVMEYMENGSLKEYLISRRPDDSNTTGLPPLTEEQMKLIAAQIADGMAYLEAKKFVHRDLAARNCLVTADGTCKIGDFGLARDLYFKEYYKLSERRMMPARWMPPEAFRDGTFSSRTDVWSYGVLLYEITSYATLPYSCMANQEVIDYIVDQRRTLTPPKNCPTFLADVMLSTWAYEPAKRPSFDHLVSLLASFGDAKFKQISYYHTQRGTDLKPFRKTFTSSAGNSDVTPNGNLSSADQACLVQTTDTDIKMQTSIKTKVDSPICNNNRRKGLWSWLFSILPLQNAQFSEKEARSRRAANGYTTTLNRGRTKC